MEGKRKGNEESMHLLARAALNILMAQYYPADNAIGAGSAHTRTHGAPLFLDCSSILKLIPATMPAAGPPQNRPANNPFPPRRARGPHATRKVLQTPGNIKRHTVPRGRGNISLDRTVIPFVRPLCRRR